MAYVGLYSGAGRAKVVRPIEIVETTALGVFRLRYPFTKYIFVDRDRRCIDALRSRIDAIPGDFDVTLLEGDTAAIAPLVRQALPQYTRGNGLLSFCFVDPFAADIKFATIRALSDHRMDFLILLMLGRDIRTNLRLYYGDPTSSRVADLIDCPDWRTEYASSGDQNIVRFVLTKFDDAMVRLGYRSATEHLRRQISATGTAVLQYVLVFYSKSQLGQQFWQDILSTAAPQTALDLR